MSDNRRGAGWKFGVLHPEVPRRLPGSAHACMNRLFKTFMHIPRFSHISLVLHRPLIISKIFIAKDSKIVNYEADIIYRRT